MSGSHTDPSQGNRLSRRRFLREAALAAGGLALAACGGGRRGNPTQVSQASPTPVAAMSPCPACTPTVSRGRATATSRVGPSQRSRTVIFDVDGGRVATPELWNPLVPGSRTDQGFHQALIEPLFILNYQTGKIEPWLAEAFVPSEDSRTWTLRLRQGVRWSDGEPFDADDVVFTITMLLEGPAELSYAASMRQWVSEVRKRDARTVEFKLKEPNPRFQLDYFAVKIYGSLPIVPAHIWKGKDPLTFKNYDPERGWPVFTGPYKLADASETEFAYVRDDHWWGAKAGFLPLPSPERLLWTVNETEETKVARAADGQLDSVMDITVGAFEALKARNPNVIAWLPDRPYSWVDPCARQLDLNLTVEPWNDRDMRWALNHAIDRTQIVNIAYEGSTTPSTFMFPAYPPLNRYVQLLEREGLFKRYPVGTYDPEKTRQILESKGYRRGSDGYYAKDGKQLSLQIDTADAFIELKRVAQVVVEQLQQAGINATTRTLAVATWGDNIAFGRYEAAINWDACGSVNEPWSSMQHFTAGWYTPVGKRAPDNAIRWRNARYTELVERMGSLQLNDRRIEDLFLQAAEVWLQELPFIPLTQAKKLVPFDTTYWQGWPSQQNGYLHPPTWWNSAHKIIHHLRPTGR